MTKLQDMTVELDYAGIGTVEFTYNRVEYFLQFSRQGNIATCSIDAYKSNSQHYTTVYYDLDKHTYTTSNEKTNSKVINQIANMFYDNYKE